MSTLLRSLLGVLVLVGSMLLGSACQPDPDAAPTPLSPEAVAERAPGVLSIADPLERALQTAALLRRSPPEALPALQQAIAEAPLDLGDPELELFAMWWADFDPLSALTWPSEDWRASYPTVVNAMFEMNAYNQGEVAFKTLGAASQFRDAAISGVIAGWLRAGGEGLIEHVQAIPDLALRQNVSESLGHRLVIDLGAEGALERVTAMQESGFRTQLLKRVASAAAFQGEAEGVAQWAEEQVTSGDERPSGLPRRIGTRWIRRDPAAAFAWLSTLPAGKDRNDGVMESFRDWMLADRTAASAWAESIEPEAWNEPALSIYLRQLGMRDPQEALTRLASFEGTERVRSMARIGRRWLSRDPGPAAEWLSTAEVLPPGVRNRLRPYIEEARKNAAEGRSGAAYADEDDAALLESIRNQGGGKAGGD